MAVGAAKSFASACTALAVCGCAAVGRSPAATGPEGPHVTLETGAIEVLPQGEQFTCTFLDYATEVPLPVWATTARQVQFGHHLGLYYTLARRAPQQVPCGDVDPTDLRLVAPAAEEAGRAFLLPEGTALIVPKGAQLVLHSHHVNPTEAAYTAHDSLDVFLREPSEVTSTVDTYTFNDGSLLVPAGTAAYESITTCHVERDLDVFLFVGQMREHGQRYRLEVVDEAGNVQTTLADDPWMTTSRLDPPVHWFSFDEPLHLPAGARLRQTCLWANPGTAAIPFPAELCLASFLYFPGDGELVCEGVKAAQRRN